MFDVQVEASANALALRLLATGMQPGARVGILLPRGLHLPVAMLAVLKAGGTYVPLDPYYPQVMNGWSSLEVVGSLSVGQLYAGLTVCCLL